METLGIEIGGKGYPIGEAGFDVEFIQNAVPVSGIARGFGGFLFVYKPFGVLRGEIVVGITEERFSGGDEFGVVFPQAQDTAFARRGSLGIHVGIVGESGV